ncbi:MAG: Holliday junction branch migration protein RuvA [Candidatus Saccharimonadales bacterium]
MIASLFGEVTTKSFNEVIIDVNGVGYALYVSSQEYEDLHVGERYKLFVHENIREDAFDLYGFVSDESKRLFELLISVKNIGPKAALAILSIGPADKLRAAIASGDITFLTSAKGVGKKAAEQVIVELRDKVGLVSTAAAEDIVLRGAIDLSDEAMQALVSLGYSEQDAATFLKKVDPNLPVDERLRRALKGASK